MNNKTQSKEQRLIRYLKQECRGEENAIYGKDLARYLGITTRELRDMKGRIVLNHKIDIGSTGSGYFYSSNDTENKKMEKGYMSRIKKYSKLAKAYRDIRKIKNQKKFKGMK